MKQVFEIEWDRGSITAELIQGLLWDYLNRFGGMAVSLRVREKLVGAPPRPEPNPADEAPPQSY